MADVLPDTQLSTLNSFDLCHSIHIFPPRTRRANLSPRSYKCLIARLPSGCLISSPAKGPSHPVAPVEELVCSPDKPVRLSVEGKSGSENKTTMSVQRL